MIFPARNLFHPPSEGISQLAIFDYQREPQISGLHANQAQNAPIICIGLRLAIAWCFYMFLSGQEMGFIGYPKTSAWDEFYPRMGGTSQNRNESWCTISDAGDGWSKGREATLGHVLKLGPLDPVSLWLEIQCLAIPLVTGSAAENASWQYRCVSMAEASHMPNHANWGTRNFALGGMFERYHICHAKLEMV